MHNISQLLMELKFFSTLGLISSTSLVGAYWVVPSLSFLCAQLKWITLSQASGDSWPSHRYISSYT